MTFNKNPKEVVILQSVTLKGLKLNNRGWNPRKSISSLLTTVKGLNIWQNIFSIYGYDLEVYYVEF